ncbi:hypothetical protein [Tsukamurella sp. PLM1]|uniref:hypothetical protein n=1 Tax=Tsukamurella sp. PLM1 TaxID=2929795 RepID=UPI00205498B2|nr:hypothetical protein [Tsukamurella sp. PLM1]BDH56859.1 hypothetical protein MTP03_17980 [Tsukamurella sp. PLM1]
MVKLLINVVLTVLIVFALRPSIADIAGRPDALAAGIATDRDAISSWFYPPSVSLALLSWATVLAVVKPWGRVRRRRAPRDRRPPGNDAHKARTAEPSGGDTATLEGDSA